MIHWFRLRTLLWIIIFPVFHLIAGVFSLRLIGVPEHRILGQYVIKFHANAHGARSFDSLQATNSFLATHPAVTFVRSSGYMAMFGALSDSELQRVEALEGVHYSQHNMRYVAYNNITIAGNENPYSWGLDRIDQITLPLNNKYRWKNNGSLTDVFILDSGINTKHPDWRTGQAIFYSDCSSNEHIIHTCTDSVDPGDPFGHGTHVAGTVASPSFGVAKGARVFSVRVLDETGTGTSFETIAGIGKVIEYAKQQKLRNPERSVVINLSLGVQSAEDTAVLESVDAAVTEGIVVVAAAGNYASDACEDTPARDPLAITVGAASLVDTAVGFSNWGTCMNIHAPGIAIRSLNAFFRKSGDLSVMMSGTSMACPHVVGAVAIIRSMHPEYTPSQVTSALTQLASPRLSGAHANTTNLLLMIYPGATVPSKSTVFGIETHQLFTFAVCVSYIAVALSFVLWSFCCVSPELFPSTIETREPFLSKSKDNSLDTLSNEYYEYSDLPGIIHKRPVEPAVPNSRAKLFSAHVKRYT